MIYKGVYELGWIYSCGTRARLGLKVTVIYKGVYELGWIS